MNPSTAGTGHTEVVTSHKESASAGPSLPDIVYPYRHINGREELKYSLRTVARNVPHRKVWVVGPGPRAPWFSDEVGFIETPPYADKGPRMKRFRRVASQLRYACEVDDITETFLLYNDDFFILRPYRGATPLLHLGPLIRGTRQRKSRYGNGFRELDLLFRNSGLPRALNYEPHVPMPIVREDFPKALDALDVPPETVLHYRSIYGNLAAPTEGKLLNGDPKVYSSTMNVPSTWSVMSMSDQAWWGRAGKLVRTTFTEPSPYER